MPYMMQAGGFQVSSYNIARIEATENSPECYNVFAMNPYLNLRRALERRLPDGLIVLHGGLPVPRNHDVEFVFRQKSDFLYLTGVEEPGCALLVDPRRRRHTLFIPRIDNNHRVWLGHVPGP